MANLIEQPEAAKAAATKKRTAYYSYVAIFPELHTFVWEQTGSGLKTGRESLTISELILAGVVWNFSQLDQRRCTASKTQLGVECGWTRQYITRLLTRLVEKNVLVRRGRHVALTQAFREQYQALRNRMRSEEKPRYIKWWLRLGKEAGVTTKQQAFLSDLHIQEQAELAKNGFPPPTKSQQARRCRISRSSIIRYTKSRLGGLLQFNRGRWKSPKWADRIAKAAKALGKKTKIRPGDPLPPHLQKALLAAAKKAASYFSGPVPDWRISRYLSSFREALFPKLSGVDWQPEFFSQMLATEVVNTSAHRSPEQYEQILFKATDTLIARMQAAQQG